MKHLLPLSLLLTVTLCAPVSAQFRAEFDDGALATDPRGLDGWAFFTGDGEATMAFEPGDGYASIRVDATADTFNVWWALIKHRERSLRTYQTVARERYR